MAKSDQRVRRLSRRDPDDHQLHPKTERILPGQYFYLRDGGLAGTVRHIDNYDFTPVIKKALEMPGFPEDTNGRSVMCGFGHNTVLGIAGTVIDAVKSKAIRHFFLVGGCDGAKPGRSYYKEFVEKVPQDCVVLTLACGKFRFFDQDLGTIGGIPRLLDIGQCNDAYSNTGPNSANTSRRN